MKKIMWLSLALMLIANPALAEGSRKTFKFAGITMEVSIAVAIVGSIMWLVGVAVLSARETKTENYKHTDAEIISIMKNGDRNHVPVVRFFDNGMEITTSTRFSLPFTLYKEDGKMCAKYEHNVGDMLPVAYCPGRILKLYSVVKDDNDGESIRRLILSYRITGAVFCAIGMGILVLSWFL